MSAGGATTRTVVWDVDDVLCPLMATWLERAWRPDHPEAPPYAALTENPPHRVLGVERDVYHASLDAFRHAHYASLQPAPAVVEFFRTRGARYRHVALTATPRATAPVVSRWVLAHFGDWIRVFAVVPSPRASDREVGGQLASKARWLEWFGQADVFLDDAPGTVAAVREAGFEAWLVAQPWNDGVPLDALLERL